MLENEFLEMAQDCKDRIIDKNKELEDRIQKLENK